MSAEEGMNLVLIPSVCSGMQVRRVPIEDFNGDDLARLVKEGARAVDDMVLNHRVSTAAPPSMHARARARTRRRVCAC